MNNSEAKLARFSKKVEGGRNKFRAIRNRKYWRQKGKRTVLVLKSHGEAVELSY